VGSDELRRADVAGRRERVVGRQPVGRGRGLVANRFGLTFGSATALLLLAYSAGAYSTLRKTSLLSALAGTLLAVGGSGSLRPDLVLMDVRMPLMGGLAATRRIAELGLVTRVVMLTTFDLDEYVFDALDAGASGFLLKNASAEQLVASIRLVATGEALLAPTITRRLIRSFGRQRSQRSPASGALSSLSARELEVLKLMARGLSNAEVAEALQLGLTTVKSHVAATLEKLGLRDRVQAVVLAHRLGIIDDDA
jgi:DNA-binding NarL/FixJ family response regulator